MNDSAAIIARVGEALAYLPLQEPIVGLGGAHAKGQVDAHSDIDFYVFASGWPGVEQLELQIAQLLPDATAFKSWSGEGEFGIDFSLAGQVVEVWFRLSSPVLEAAARAHAGTVEREDRVWTPNGFYRVSALADLSAMVVLHCRDEAFAAALESIRNYPDALRDAAFAMGMGPQNFWRGNMHLDTALARVDSYYLQSIFHQVRNGLIQSAFALNRKYFGGDKKMAQSLAALDTLPEGFADAVLPSISSGSETEAFWRDQFAALFAAGTALQQLFEAEKDSAAREQAQA